MDYSQQNWVDYSLDTPLSAARLNHIEAALAELAAAVSGGDAVAAGAVAGSPTSAALNTQVINNLLTGGNVSLPAGTFWINDSIKIPSYRWLHGAGQGLTWIKMVDGAPFNSPAVTNSGNTFTSHTTPNVYLRISDLSVDGGRANRAAGTSVNEGGCAIQLACVEHSTIERVHATNGQHSFDISASMYRDDGPALYAQGPSRWVTVRDCVGEYATGQTDDQFTTHHSQHIWFENCVAINPTARVTYNNSHGFEADDGSQDIVFKNCYAYGFNSGFQAKGHPLGPPARRVTFEDCVADTCRVGFDIQSLDATTYDGSDGALPTGYAVSADVQVIRGRVRNITDTLGDGSNDQMAVRLVGYTDVEIRDLIVQDSPRGFIKLQDHCGRIVLDTIVFENSWTAPPAYAVTKGLGAIAVGTAAGTDPATDPLRPAGDHITIKNVVVRTAGIAANTPVISVAQNTNTYLTIDGVEASGSGNGAVVYQAGAGTDWSVTNLDVSGWTSDIFDATA